MTLDAYNKKRNFTQTPEPKGKKSKSKALHFVVQKHDASHLHYDFRLEFGGVLHSWAVPKGPSLNPKDKRLAMEVEDHPVSYMQFEGTIPKGNYGAGDVIVWDFGLYTALDTAHTEKEIQRAFQEGKIKIVLYGEKLKGGFTLVKMKDKDKNTWLLMKEKDEYASTEDVTQKTFSVLSHANLPRDQGRVVKKSPMPHSIKPMLAKLISEPFDRDDWIFEMKWDGYRAIAEIENGKIKLYSRNGLDFKRQYPIIVEKLHVLLAHDCILDGEIIALKNGKPDFHALQQYKENPLSLQYMIFDLLYLDGEDLRKLPLIERKSKLRRLLNECKDNDIVFSDHVEKDGVAFFEKIKESHLEGMVAKEAQSSYLVGVRSPSWLKIKTVLAQEAIIVGFTEPRKGRKYMGSLVLGAYIGGELRYIGHSGGGFTDTELADISKKLKQIISDTPNIKEKIKINSPITWVKPQYVCQIKFTEWTADGRMRHPIFMGLRTDKKAEEVTREMPEKALPKTKTIKKVKNISTQPARTHTDKIFWPDEGYTKGDVLDYYDRMSSIILPYQKDRPQNLLRHPNGIRDKGFFQKDITFQVPEFVELKNIWSESNNSYLRYLLCQNKETLLYIVNLGCIELNPWNSRIDHLDKPDYIIIDLDPSDENSFEELICVAQEVRKVLDLLCEENYIKTSGKTGLHICVPVGAKYTYEELKPLSHMIVKLVNQRLPEITSIERKPSKRKGLVYLDYLQNRRGQTLASVYSLRPYPGATVSTPLEWKEVKKGLNPANFNIKAIEKRLDKKGDLWKPVLSHAIDLGDSLRCLEEHFHFKP